MADAYTGYYIVIERLCLVEITPDTDQEGTFAEISQWLISMLQLLSPQYRNKRAETGGSIDVHSFIRPYHSRPTYTQKKVKLNRRPSNWVFWLINKHPRQSLRLHASGSWSFLGFFIQMGITGSWCAGVSNGMRVLRRLPCCLLHLMLYI